MITNNTVTFFRFSQQTENYKPMGTCKAWVFSKKGISGDTHGDKNTDTVHIRININSIKTVNVGDFVYVGKCNVKEPELTKCRKVTRVSENNFGSVPHWHIEAG